MVAARLYQREKSAMQSGRARARGWLLEFEPDEAKRADPLMGWAGSGFTREQLRIPFETLEAAQAYAAAHDVTVRVVPASGRKLKLQAYSDNFK